MRRLALVVLAVCAAIAPFPPALVEDHYSRGVYPTLQYFLTALSNTATFAFFDGVLIALALILFVLLLRRGRVLNVLGFFAIVYLVFLATWGLNYRRAPLSDALDYDDTRLTRARVLQMGKTAVAELNRLHREVQAVRAPELDDLAQALAPAMSHAANDLGLEPPLPARPKQTWLAPYFRRAGIDGMTDPFFLETLLVPDLLDVEQPAALAHEWGHLAGLANEAEAGYFGWLTCLRSDARAQYSGWLALYPHLANALPEKERQRLHAQLGPGPREDFARIARRLDQIDERVRKAASTSYDTFLRANRVEDGVASYDAVVRLVIGTNYSGRFIPRRK